MECKYKGTVNSSQDTFISTHVLKMNLSVVSQSPSATTLSWFFMAYFSWDNTLLDLGELGYNILHQIWQGGKGVGTQHTNRIC